MVRGRVHPPCASGLVGWNGGSSWLLEDYDQGEHKVPRGFEPTVTWSAHWIADPRFRRAIDQYLNVERAQIDQYILEVEQHTPFRRT